MSITRNRRRGRKMKPARPRCLHLVAPRARVYRARRALTALAALAVKMPGAPVASLLAVALTCGGCLVKVEQPNLAGQDVRLTIIHTADLHSRLFPYQFSPGAIDRGLGLVPTKGNIAVVGGMARIATVIKRER